MRTLQCGMGWFPEEPGGLNRMFYHLTRRLPEQGVAVRGLVAGTPDVARASGGSTRAFAERTAAMPARWLGARRAARACMADVDLVAVHFALYGLPVVGLAGSRPVVVHFHGPWALEGAAEGQGRLATLVKQRLERAVYGRADRFVVLSRAFARLLTHHYGVPPERICVVPGGVDARAFDTGLTRAEAREQLGWPVDRPTVVAVRRLRRRMGLESLVEAMAAVTRRRPAARLVLAGAGPLRAELEGRVAALGLERHVHLAGFVPDAELPLVYRAADLCVVPSQALEGFGLVAVEALAAGTPCLVSPVGGLPEIVGPLAPQLVLPDPGAAALAERLLEVLEGSVPLPTDAACRTWARTRYDWQHVAGRTRAVYAEVLAR